MSDSGESRWPPSVVEPYAFNLLRRLRAGETVRDLAAREGIPVNRIEMRVRAAQICERMRDETGIVTKTGIARLLICLHS